MASPVLSIVAPAYNEERNLPAFIAAIVATASALRWSQHNVHGLASDSTRASVVRRIAGTPDAPLRLFLLAYAGELVVYAAVGGMFDRYLWPMVPVAAILLLRGAHRPFPVGRAQALAFVALAWLLVSAFVLTANSFAYDAARYRAGDRFRPFRVGCHPFAPGRAPQPMASPRSTSRQHVMSGGAVTPALAMMSGISGVEPKNAWNVASSGHTSTTRISSSVA